jgi:predicted acetyltransferase
MHGTFSPVFAGDDTTVLNDIHKAYIANLNHGIRRDYWPGNKAWKMFTESDPYKTGTFLYLWRNEKGEAKSYMKYFHSVEDGDNTINIKELAYVDREGMYGALSLLSGMSSQYSNFTWKAPTFINATDIVDELWELNISYSPSYQTRIVNVPKALELMRRPEGSGRYTVEVDDDFMPVNNGTYLVEYSPSGSKVSKTDDDADLSCDMPVLSQLVMGYRTLDDALVTRKEGLDVNDNIETLRKVFTARPQHCSETF